MSLSLLVLLDTATACAAWRTPPVAPRRASGTRFRVLVPAHDEAHVLPGLLQDLSVQDYAADLVDVVVLADRCADATARVAREAGSRAVERDEGPPGKGPALAWALDREPLSSDEALVVLDADNRVPSDLLSRLADELSDGADAVQCYLDVVEPEENWLTLASALSYWTGNRLTQVARRNLGLSSDLGGTGMCLTPLALETADFGDALSEDRELAVRLVLAGIRVRWLHHVRVLDEKPASLAVAVRQRGRWGRGLDQVRRRYLLPLVLAAVRRPDAAAADFALRLVRPSRTGTAALTLLVVLGQAVVPTTRHSARQRRWLALLAVQLAVPPVLLARDGVPARLVLRYPLALVMPALSAAGRLQARLRGDGTTWYHTPHRGARS